MLRIVVVAAALLAAGAPASANDSTARTAAGGLILTRSAEIDMVSEDLFISARQVRIRYVFRNRSARDVTTLVAFPMPLRPSDELGDVAYPTGFVTRVDGRAVATRLERKPIGRARGRGAPTSDTYYWNQAFPAVKDVVVEHSYAPGTGGSVGTGLVMADFRRSAEGRAMIRTYCADSAFLAGIDRMARQAGGDYPTLPEEKIGYVLKTGANWRSPIGRFRLVVDKGAPENLVSFCGDGVRRISPTQFEMVKTNWRPTRDLEILIVKPAPVRD
jgi:hypothetical protein